MTPLQQARILTDAKDDLERAITKLKAAGSVVADDAEEAARQLRHQITDLIIQEA